MPVNRRPGRRRLAGGAAIVLAGCSLLVVQAMPASAASPGRRDLMEMASGGRFDELERELATLQSAYKASRDRASEDAVQSAFIAFRNTKSGLGVKLTQWRAQMPDSCAASLALGNRDLTVAETARGGRWAKDTNDAQFATMEEYLRAAVKNLQAAVRCDPSLTPAWAGLINAGNLSSDRTLPEQSLRDGLAASPSSLHIRMAYLDTLAPKWGGSMKQVDDFVAESRAALSPDAFAILEGIADLIHAAPLVDAARYAEAQPIFDRAVQRAGHWVPLVSRGTNLLRLGRAPEAIADFDRALALRPESSPIYEQRARALVEVGRYKDALADLDAALVFNDRDPEVLGYRSWLLSAKLNRTSDGLADANAALELGHQRGFTWVQRGYALRRDKADPELIRQAFLKAIELDPADPPAWYGYGVAMYDQHSSACLDAFDHYLYLCRDDPHSRCAQEDLDWLNGLVRLPSTYLNWPRVLLRPHLMGLLL